MRILLLSFFLIISFQHWTKADDIRDFEIEGISLGDSLLSFYNKDEIDNNLRNFYNDESYLISLLPTLNKESMYEYIQVHFKKNDREYIVKSIDGLIDIDIKECLNLQNKVVNEISSMFENVKKEGPFINKHSGDKSGKSTTKHIEWVFNDTLIEVVCYDFVEPMEFLDGLNVAITSNEIRNWLNNKAYN